MEILSVTRSVAQYLRNSIITGELSAGERLNEVQLTEQLGISRGPLREAFRILENAYLVESIPRKGTFVTGISQKDLEENYAARVMIECYAIEIFRDKNVRKPEGLESAILASEELVIPSQDDAEKMLEFWRIFADFHVKLVHSCGNSLLVRFYNIISEKLARYQLMYLRIPGTGNESIRDHRQVLSLLEAGAYEQAQETLKKHLNYAYQRIKTEAFNSPRPGS